MTLLTETYCGKKVLVTGDSGFKGAWLASWLNFLGAEVHGVSLPPTADAVYSAAALPDTIRHHDCDIRDFEHLCQIVDEVRADFVFHLAAQSLVRDSYEIPRETFEVNVSGTANVLESVRRQALPCVVVVISSDKCYENHEWPYAYRENDAMGGHDPYSASKGCVEVLTTSYNRSFFLNSEVRCASARAGNVVGPGDWARDRIVPDAMRAFRNGKSLVIRNPNSIRPWQHVLEPLSGYLLLGARMAEDRGHRFCRPYNFGPRPESARSVGTLVETLAEFGQNRLTYEIQNDDGPHEAQYLKLAIDRAVTDLGWGPVWNFEETIQHTWNGYAQIIDAPDMASGMLQKQIDDYTERARTLSFAWAK